MYNILYIALVYSDKRVYLCIAFPKKAPRSDSLAQLVEHNTFNVGVLGSSPRRITKRKRPSQNKIETASFLILYIRFGKANMGQ